ncbi:MAG: flagellar biosynthesis protein FlhG [Planctomycetota bacterium]|jgi:flagellar biosynthesis protein FlhG
MPVGQTPQGHLAHGNSVTERAKVSTFVAEAGNHADLLLIPPQLVSMSWFQARSKFRAASRPREGREAGNTKPVRLSTGRLATSVCVVSGKGGTGKSLVSASLSSYLARDRETLLIDADLGAGNAHILHDVSPVRTMVDVVRGLPIEEAIEPCRPGLDLIGGGSGYARMASLHSRQLGRIATELERMDSRYEGMVIDSAAGLSTQTLAFAAAADIVLLVTNPDVTALTDAYAFLKVLTRRGGKGRTLVAVNRASGADEAEAVCEKLCSVARKYLGTQPKCVGFLPEDRAAFRSTQRRVPVIDGETNSPLGLALETLGARIAREIHGLRPAGFGASMRNQVPA